MTDEHIQDNTEQTGQSIVSEKIGIDHQHIQTEEQKDGNKLLINHHRLVIVTLTAISYSTCTSIMKSCIIMAILIIIIFYYYSKRHYFSGKASYSSGQAANYHIPLFIHCSSVRNK